MRRWVSVVRYSCRGARMKYLVTLFAGWVLGGATLITVLMWGEKR